MFYNTTLHFRRFYFLFVFWCVLLWDSFSAYAQTTNMNDADIEQQLTHQFGPDFLPALRQMGKTPQDYIYAARLVQVALQKINEQDYHDARFLLEKAYSIIPSPHVLYWMAKTHEGLLNLVYARRLYLDFIDEAARWTLTPIKNNLLQQARQTIAHIERQLCWVRLQVSQNDAKIYIDGEFVGKSPIRSAIPVKSGPHTIVVIKPGFVRQDINVVLTQTGKEVEQTITLLTEAEAIRQSQVFRETEKQRLETQRRLEETRRRVIQEERRRRQLYATWARGLLLGALATGVMTAGSAVLSWHYQKQVDQAPPDTSWKSVSDDHDRAHIFRVTSYIGLGITMVAGGISTWLTQVSVTPIKKSWAVTPWVSVDSVGMAMSWTF